MIYSCTSFLSLYFENLTANHSGAQCWERCHVPRTLKNLLWFSIGVGIFALRNRRLNCPTLPITPFCCGIQSFSILLSLYPIPFFISSSSLYVHFLIPFHVHLLNIAEILLLWCWTPTINQSIFFPYDQDQNPDQIHVQYGSLMVTESLFIITGNIFGWFEEQ